MVINNRIVRIFHSSLPQPASFQSLSSMFLKVCSNKSLLLIVP